MSKKSKYYMRGIGVGILVCALILIISRKNTQPVISDEEIISRARALGMVESGDQTLTEATGVSDAEVSPSVTQSPLPTPLASPSSSPEASVYPVLTSASTEPSVYPVLTSASTEPSVYPVLTSAVPEETDSPEPSAEPEPSVTPESSLSASPSPEASNDQLLTDLVYVTLTVYSGNSSDTIARRAEELGLVTNSREFDAYLVTNGYANRIRVGSFEIPLGASYEYIAKAIT
ncbi:MAG: hypothetical protein J6I66_01060 [Lachnospiraceae bacterium]|nr:hypothetical protein [Lachnospiraceae bacterium]